MLYLLQRYAATTCVRRMYLHIYIAYFLVGTEFRLRTCFC